MPFCTVIPFAPSTPYQMSPSSSPAVRLADDVRVGNIDLDLDLDLDLEVDDDRLSSAEEEALVESVNKMLADAKVTYVIFVRDLAMVLRGCFCTLYYTCTYRTFRPICQRRTRLKERRRTIKRQRRQR